MNDNKGYTLMSMVLTLMVLASMTTLLLKKDTDINIEHLSFINTYLGSQVEALTNYTRIDLNEEGITFNKLGHVNRAQTITKGNHDVIVHLGNGYLTYE